MFQFGRLALRHKCRSYTSSMYKVVLFGNLRIYRLCAAPRSLSQLTTSFIASQTQGIHHTPLIALKKLMYLEWITPLIMLLVTTYYFPICQRTSQCANVQICKCANWDADNVDLNHVLPIELPKVWKELFVILVEDIGVEPMTLCVQGRCSSQLS